MSELVSLVDVTKSYQQADLTIDVLRGVSLTIREGEFVALQGPSGSGKSTLMHIIGLLDRLTTGTYALDGRDVSHLDDDEQSELRNQLTGFIFQSFYLIPYATALDNVAMPGVYAGTARSTLRRRASELLDRVGLGDRKDFKPAQLSGGQQQRVALARALVNDPRLILADEPTGQLDSTTSQEIMELLAEINAAGTTIIVVTHDPPTASYAKRRIAIEDGLIVDGGEG
jgi:putative ABC transport system ATP-binding protein